MELQVKKLDGTDAGKITVSDAIFGLEPRAELVGQDAQLLPEQFASHRIQRLWRIDRAPVLHP